MAWLRVQGSVFWQGVLPVIDAVVGNLVFPVLPDIPLFGQEWGPAPAAWGKPVGQGVDHVLAIHGKVLGPVKRASVAVGSWF